MSQQNPVEEGTVGALVRSARAAAGISLTKLAELVRTSPSQMSAIENGKQEPNLRTLKKIADALNLDLEVAFSIKEEPARAARAARKARK